LPCSIKKKLIRRKHLVRFTPVEQKFFRVTRN
jgi:hypothetical protein